MSISLPPTLGKPRAAEEVGETEKVINKNQYPRCHPFLLVWPFVGRPVT